MKQELAIISAVGGMRRVRNPQMPARGRWGSEDAPADGRKDWFKALAVAILAHAACGLCSVLFLFRVWSVATPASEKNAISLDLNVVSAPVRAPLARPIVREEVAAPVEVRPPPPALVLPESVMRVALPEPALPPPPTLDSACTFRPESVVSAIEGGALPAFPAGSRGVGTEPLISAGTAAVESGAGGTGKGDIPTALSEIRPRYPFRSRSDGEEGMVMVRVRVSEEGTVQEATVTRTSGFRALDDAAVAAVRKAQFAPAERGGRHVAGEISLTFQFTLKE